MSNVIQFKQRPPKSLNVPIIHKVINGKAVECIDVDALTPTERADFFNGKYLGAPMQKGLGAPDC